MVLWEEQDGSFIAFHKGLCTECLINIHLTNHMGLPYCRLRLPKEGEGEGDIFTKSWKAIYQLKYILKTHFNERKSNLEELIT